MAFELLEERVAVIADPEEEVSESGLYLPDSGREVLRYGTVAVVGHGRATETAEWIVPDVDVDDRVFFNRASGSTLTIEGTEYLILAAREIVGIIRDDA